MSRLGADAIFVCDGRERAATIVKDCGGGTVNLMVFGADIDEKPVQLETSVPHGSDVANAPRCWFQPSEYSDELIALIDSRVEKMLDGAPDCPPDVDEGTE